MGNFTTRKSFDVSRFVTADGEVVIAVSEEEFYPGAYQVTLTALDSDSPINEMKNLVKNLGVFEFEVDAIEHAKRVASVLEVDCF